MTAGKIKCVNNSLDCMIKYHNYKELTYLSGRHYEQGCKINWYIIILDRKKRKILQAVQMMQ